MTIREIVLKENAQGINDWIELATKLGLPSEQESILISCAEYYNKIIINHDASFIKAINI